MTGIADLYLYLKRPNKDRRQRLLSHLKSDKEEITRFVVLSWKRTGSNLLCGIIHLHPEICMHNELFNPIDIFTYHPKVLNKPGEGRWTVQTRDLYPVQFLEHIWDSETIERIRPNKNSKAVGFKSFPDHWIDVRNEHIWQDSLLEDLRVKKIVLHRRDELAVYVSTQRAGLTGHYMTYSYPSDLKIHIDPADFQVFVNNYHHTFRNAYRSPIAKRDTFWVEYEQLVDEEHFESDILPKLWKFLGVDPTTQLRRLRETVKQADPAEDLSTVISNYNELEFCFRHTDVLHFANRREAQEFNEPTSTTNDIMRPNEESRKADIKSWSILLPICSRPRISLAKQLRGDDDEATRNHFNTNRFTDLSVTSQHVFTEDEINADASWGMLETFCSSLTNTVSAEQMALTECIVGIDEDDIVFRGQDARDRIQEIIPCEVVFVDIIPDMYGHVCKIWNYLASKANYDFIVLLGDDVKLLDSGWQEHIVSRFQSIAEEEGLPFGAACVAMNDLSFPGFPTFPVLHRWHMQAFGSLLPNQFANQGGDPYLYELYSRFNAADFSPTSRMENTIGGDGDARYEKHQINWRTHILNMNLRKMKAILGGRQPTGVVLDIVVPSYRINNNDFLERIALLRASVKMYVKFWFVVDNPDEDHLASVKRLADKLNEDQLKVEGNYFINVLHYSGNRGASYARNFGYNFTTADWVLFLDDDVIPDGNILDAYAGSIRRYPNAKVFVGLTELPKACNLWTQMLCACNIGYFYSIAQRMVHPSWGVTANLMVRGSRHNSTIQFKDIYPKTGGGEDIDLVYQFKEWYHDGARGGPRVTVGVPGAKVKHPWWNQSRPCYRHIMGWAWGDSLCITEWGKKTFLTFPNWIEYVTFLLPPLTVYTGNPVAGLVAGLGVTLLAHTSKGFHYYSDALRETAGGGLFRTIWVALGAGTVLSAQEVTRTFALVRRRSLYSLCRRVDWFDGEEKGIQLNAQLQSLLGFGVRIGWTWAAFRFVGTRN
jgi:hypothetical protein